MAFDWNPIDSAPKDDKPVDLWVDQGRNASHRFVRVTDCRWLHDQDCWMEVSDTRYRPVSGTPTHWMRVEGPTL